MSISTSTLSPGFSHSGGWRLAPTPPGVPLAMTSPGSSWVKVEQYSICRGISKFISAIVVSCTTWPLTRVCDPLLRVAKPIMAEIVRFAPAGSIVLLCRIFRETVLCVHQVTETNVASGVSYERGRPMPLFKGATSKIILAHLPLRELRRLFDAHQPQLAAAKLGDTWEAFRQSMAKMRKAGHALSFAEIDPERIGIAAPILDEHGRVLGSLSYVILSGEERAVARLASLAMTGAREIEAGMRADAGAQAPGAGA